MSVYKFSRASAHPHTPARVWIVPARSKLPTDVVEHTCAHLWDSPQSLRSCALVCRLWLQAARPCIFRSILLDDTASLSNQDRMNQLLELLRRDRVVRHWIRELRIRIFQGSQDRYHPTNMCHLIGYLGPETLQNVHSISLLQIRFPLLLQESAEIIQTLAKLPSVKFISIPDGILDYNGLKLLPGSFPRLRSLRIDNVEMALAAEYLHPFDIPEPSRITSLAIGLRSTRSLQPLASLIQHSDALQTLQLDMGYLASRTIGTIHWFRPLWAGVSRALHTLELNLWKMDDSVNIPPKEWGLDHLTGLRVFRAVLDKYTHLMLTQILHELPSKNLQMIRFSVPSELLDGIGLKAERCRESDQVLCRMTFGQLKEVVFTYYGPLSQRFVEAYLHEGFPLLRGIGVLRIEKKTA